MTLREVSPSSLTLRPSLITMASSCMFVGTVGVKKSSSESLGDKKKFWKHEVTLTRAAIDLRIDPFAHGQLYTALSRVRHRDDCLLIFSEENEERDSANVVYTSLLL